MAATRESLAVGLSLIQSGQLPRAEHLLREIVAVDPLSVQGWFLLGAAVQLQGKVADAAACYERVLEREPDHASALNNLGYALHTQGQVGEALARLKRALELKPEYADAHSNLGNVLQDLGQLDDAVASYRRALALNPDYFDAIHNLGNALRAQGRVAESIKLYDRALELKPGHPLVHMSRAMAWLQSGDFERGWPEYEWRLKCSDGAIPAFRQPMWDGSPLDGRRILLYADFGLGDAIQFIRYAALVRERGGRVLVACPRPLERLAARCPGVDEVVPEGAPLPEFDVYALLMSLPGIVGSTLATSPANVPYLSIEPERVDAWRRRLADADGFKVGIVWQGNPQHKRDRHRSFPLDQFERLARIEGVRLVSLQKGYGVEQLAKLNRRFDVIDFGAELADLAETAALVQSVDLIIAADTALAHLAGALAVPVWVALPVSADWRWLMDRDDSPWYPTMRLFRQHQWGNWDEVFGRIEAQLRSPIATDAAIRLPRPI